MKTQKTPLPRQLMMSSGIVGALAGIGLLLTYRPKEAPAAPPSRIANVEVSALGASVLHIQTALVRREMVADALTATGVLAYPSDQTVKISPRVQGRVRQVYARVGDRVQAGQTLAILESVDAATALTAARQSENKLRLAKSNLERQERLFHLGTPEVTAAQAALDQAQAQVLYKKEALARLKEQEKIGGFTQKPLEDARTATVQARSDLAQAQADLAQAERDTARKAKLVAIGISAKSEQESAQNVVDKARIAAQADQEKVALAQQQLEREQKAFQSNLYANQQVRAGESDTQQAQLLQQAAERGLRLAQAAIRRDLEQAKSDLQAARADYQNARLGLKLIGNPDSDGAVRVVAPTSGTVVERNVNVGQVVDQSQMTPWQMFTISSADTVWLDADVYEKDIARVTPGAKTRIHVAALPGKTFEGHITHIAPTLDPKTRAVKARAELANPNGLLKDGMFADMAILDAKGQPATLVPLTAIQHDGDRDYVYVEQKGSYVKRAVQVGASRKSDCIIRSGLQPGERVVTHGALFLGTEANGG